MRTFRLTLESSICWENSIISQTHSLHSTRIDMRQRHVLVLLAAVSLAIVTVLRLHLYGVFEIARTYATFYPYLRRHPETLFRYPTRQAPNQFVESGLVPRIIHQIMLTDGRPPTLEEYESAIKSCRNLHPNWTHHIWSDEDAKTFIGQHYPAIFPHYEGYKQSIQRANILRYALLDHYGGVYLDLDVTCLHPLDDLRHLPFLTPGAYPAGVNNAFILSRPHHSFLQYLLDRVPSRDLLWSSPYVENMLSTGCMFFSNHWISYVRSSVHHPGGKTPSEDMVYVLADKVGNMDSHMLRGAATTPLFKHGGASSWHGWDAGAIVLIGKHYGFFLGLLGLGAVFTLALIWRLSTRKVPGDGICLICDLSQDV